MTPEEKIQALYDAMNNSAITEEELRTLITESSDFIVDDINNTNLLHLAALNNNTAALDVLTEIFDLQIIIDLPDLSYNTPAHYAARIGASKALSWLNEHGADFTRENINLRTPQQELDFHAESNASEWLVTGNDGLGAGPLNDTVEHLPPTLADQLLYGSSGTFSADDGSNGDM